MAFWIWIDALVISSKEYDTDVINNTTSITTTPYAVKNPGFYIPIILTILCHFL